jgi:hypothetical protein
MRIQIDVLIPGTGVKLAVNVAHTRTGTGTLSSKRAEIRGATVV